MKAVKNQEGQSILEVVFMVPILFSFVVLLYKINMASQVAINNTQAARSQLFVLTGNAAEYPRLAYRFADYGAKWLAEEGHSRLILGVSDPSVALHNDDDGDMQPVPQTQKIARRGTTVAGSNDAGEVSLRNEIRIRNTVALCTQFNTVLDKSSGKNLDLNPQTVAMLKAKRWPFDTEVCKYE